MVRGKKGGDLAVRRGERETEVRAKYDHHRGAQLDAGAARRRDHSQLDADGAHDLVAVQQQPDTDADTTD